MYGPLPNRANVHNHYHYDISAKPQRKLRQDLGGTGREERKRAWKVSIQKGCRSPMPRSPPAQIAHRASVRPSDTPLQQLESLQSLEGLSARDSDRDGYI